MRTEAKGYFLKEYGSWSVLVIAFLVGIGVSRGFTWLVFPLFLALGMLINSKQAFTKWLRKKGDQRSFFIFIGQIAAATVILVAVFGGDVPRLLPLLAIPAAYLLMNRFAGEHFLLTELLGFALLSLAAVLAKFLITNGLDVRLFVAVALYFTAGVFKIKAVLFKKSMDRVLTVLYVLFAAVIYRGYISRFSPPASPAPAAPGKPRSSSHPVQGQVADHGLDRSGKEPGLFTPYAAVLLTVCTRNSTIGGNICTFSRKKKGSEYAFGFAYWFFFIRAVAPQR